MTPPPVTLPAERHLRPTLMDELTQLARPLPDPAEHVNGPALLLTGLACLLGWTSAIALAVWALRAAERWPW